MSQKFKKCPQCQRIYSISDLFCEDCGLRLIEEQSSSPADYQNQKKIHSAPQASSTVSPTSDFQSEQSSVSPFVQNTVTKSKSNRLLIAVIILLALLLIVLAILVFLLLQKDHKQNFNTLEDNENLITTITSGVAENNDDGFGWVESEQSQTDVLEEIPTEVQTEEPTEESTEEPTEPPTKASSESRFEVVADACSWNDAYTKCVEAGGHLAYIQSDEDLAKILEAVNASGLKYLWLGGTTAISPDNTAVIPSWLNGDNFDYVNQAGLWYAGEPSGRDYTDPDLPYEPYVMLWKVDDKWSLNDNSDVILKYYRTENIGYICQYD